MGGDNYNDVTTGSVAVNIAKADPTVTAPAYSALTYTGEALNLVSAGTSEHGTFTYATTQEGEYSTTIPQGTNAGNYTVWYKFTGDANHSDIAATEVTDVSIGKATATVTAPTANELTYTGSAQALVTAGSTTGGTLKYCLTADGEYSDAIPTGTDAGDYTVYYKVEGGDNYNDVATANIPVSIAAATLSVTASEYSGTYDGAAHGITVVCEGATIKYGESDGIYTLDASPTLTDVGSKTVYYQVSKVNYTTVTGSEMITITQASNSFTAQPTITGWTYGQSANDPTGGVASFGTITYKYCATENGEYGTYDAIVNGQAGTWYVKGFVDETTNYAAAESDAVYFTISAAAGSISYATTPVEKTLAAPAFTNPLTKVGDGIVSYTCAGDNICTVNASTGEVTLNGTPGSCTITATVTNSTSYTYATNTASYTLTVLSVLDLSLVTADTTVPDGVTVTGTLGGDYKISIAAGATVTLKNVTINRTSISNPGITCNGTATITLVGTNTVNGGTNQAGIRIGGTGTTLTIEGDGSLSATAGGMSAGIGIGRAWSAGTVTGGNIVINGGTITAQGGSQWGAGIGTGAAYETAVTIGNITINGGEVTATGGSQGGAAGIGTSYTYNNASTNMGDITINGGTVNATGNGGAAGIGTGESNGSPVNRVGSITIKNTVTQVTATKGLNATHSIGKGSSSTEVGTVTIGGVVGAISTSPYTYEPGVPLASSSVGYKVCSDGMAYATDKTLPSGVTVIGVVAYKSGSTGIVLYKQDNSGTYTWENRNSGNPSAVNVYVNDLSSTTSKSWTCGDRTQYSNCGVNGQATSWSDLQTRLTNAGCEELLTGIGNSYWTNTCPDDNNGWAFYGENGGWWRDSGKNYSHPVRPLFAF